MPYSEEGRVVLVFGSDPFALRNKVCTRSFRFWVWVFSGSIMKFA